MNYYQLAGEILAFLILSVIIPIYFNYRFTKSNRQLWLVPAIYLAIDIVITIIVGSFVVALKGSSAEISAKVNEVLWTLPKTIYQDMVIQFLIAFTVRYFVRWRKMEKHANI